MQIVIDKPSEVFWKERFILIERSTESKICGLYLLGPLK